MVIDAWMDDADGKHVNHSCYQNAPYINNRLNRSDYDVVFIEELRDILPRVEVLV